MDQLNSILLSLLNPLILGLATFAANNILRNYTQPIKDLSKRLSKLEEEREDKAERMAIIEAGQKFEQREIERLSDQLNTLLEKIESLLVNKKR